MAAKRLGNDRLGHRYVPQSAKDWRPGALDPAPKEGAEVALSRAAEFFCSLLEEHRETRYTSPLAAERIESIVTKEKRKFLYPVQKTVL